MSGPFTPGPWEEADGGIGRMVEGRHEWTAIAYVTPKPDRDASLAEGAANARLIAAAPELLEALKQMIAWANGISKGGYPGTEAAAAIAKALGTSSAEPTSGNSRDDPSPLPPADTGKTT